MCYGKVYVVVGLFDVIVGEVLQVDVQVQVIVEYIVGIDVVIELEGS